MVTAAAAPGKVLLAGEYAVLDGAWAWVAAVPPWAHWRGRVGAGWRPLHPGAEPVGVAGWLDTRAFFAAGRKLGFGSSAAAAVLGAVAAEGPATADALWRRARSWHERLVGSGGSGADLAAVIHGGSGLFRRAGEGYRWRPLPWPADVELLAVLAPQAADTRSWIARYRELSPERRRGWWKPLEAALAALAAGELSPGEAFAVAATRYRELAKLLGAELYPPSFQRCLALGEELGVAFKPSGAGGGDVGLFWVADPETGARLRRRLAAEGLPWRRLRPATGVRWWSTEPESEVR